MSSSRTAFVQDLRIGPLTVRARVEVPALRRALATLYADFPCREGKLGFADAHIGVIRGGGLRRWLWPRITFDYDGDQPFGLARPEHALLVFEGGLNWTIAEKANFFLIVHAAVVERDGRAAILPAPSGAGKSTLCAALITHGWRLLSDEMALISLGDHKLSALARPISLKNEAIEVIRAFAPDGVFSTPIHDTEKGTIAFLKPPADSVARMGEPAIPGWIVVPRYEPHARALLAPRGKAATFVALHDNAYNEHLFGRTGFEALADIVDCCDCYDFVYSDPADAVESFAVLVAGHA
jgi:HprK-related kinase A